MLVFAIAPIPDKAFPESWQSILGRRLPSPLVDTCPASPALSPLFILVRDILAHLKVAMTSASVAYAMDRSCQLRAGSLVRSGDLVHAGHMIVSLLWSTTSKSVQRICCTSVMSPNRDACPISEYEMPRISSPVFARRGCSPRNSEGTKWVS
jgi:hypothetical protein